MVVERWFNCHNFLFVDDVLSKKIDLALIFLLRSLKYINASDALIFSKRFILFLIEQLFDLIIYQLSVEMDRVDIYQVRDGQLIRLEC